MSNIHYYVTGPCRLDQTYGIAVLEDEGRRNAVTMPFLESRMLAEHLVVLLNARQVPISEFCEAYAEGKLLDALDET